ncbi:hypothetical protein DFP72DRAFT_852496 [Ephemerocybe angulata]|uniref:Uncharacterized protein n=1 Tax=Ephemerocybe angulata TaxID=980116 RepID=A0A8H6HNE1_9AGAR|nr:hypothetical protein DFP72DRAFT_852496 [Tulosesus angulatus]
MRSGMKATTAQIPPPARMLTFPTSRLSDLHIHYRTQDVLDSLEDEDARNNDEITEAATTCTLARFAQPSGFASHNIRRRARTVMMGSLKTKAAAKHTGHRAAPSRTRSDGTAVFFLPFSNDIVQQHGAKKVKCANCPATFDRGSQLTRHSASCRPAKPASPRATAAAQIAPRINPSYLKTVPPYPEHVKRHQCPKNVHYCSPAPLLYNAQKPNSSTAMLHNQARDKLEVPQSQDGGMNITSSRTHPRIPKPWELSPPQVQRKLNHPASNARKPYVTPITAAPLMVISRATNKEVTSIRCAKPPLPTSSLDLMLQKAPRSRRSHVASAFETHPPAQPVKRKRTISTGSTRLALRPQWREHRNSASSRSPALDPQFKKKPGRTLVAKAPIPPQPQTAFEQVSTPPPRLIAKRTPTHTATEGTRSIPSYPRPVLVPSTSQIEPGTEPPQSPSMYYMEGGLMRSVFLQRVLSSVQYPAHLFICTSCQKTRRKFTISREAGDKLQYVIKELGAPSHLSYHPPTTTTPIPLIHGVATTDKAGCPNCMYTADKKQNSPTSRPKLRPQSRSLRNKRLINPWILQTGFHLWNESPPQTQDIHGGSRSVRKNTSQIPPRAEYEL